MSETPTPRSPSPSVEPDGVRSSPSPSIQPQHETLERNRSAVRTVPGVTPPSHGSSIRDQVDSYDHDDYEDYVREDLRSRVFVDFEVFMEYVLHVPKDWSTQWESVIETIKVDPTFLGNLEGYRECCNNRTSLEESFYEPLAGMANAVLDVLSLPECGGIDGIESGIPQTYHVNSQKKHQGGVFNKANPSPDLVVFHKKCDTTEPNNLHWANALQVLKIESHGNAICNGEDMPKLVVGGIDPTKNHAPASVRSHGKKSAPITTPTISQPEANHLPSKLRKRPTDGSSTNQHPNKKSRMKSALSQTEEDERLSMSNPETERQLQPAHQVYRYLMEMFSIPLLRSHATVSLVDRDRLQLYHANRSVILVSSAINFSGDDGLKKFIATIIAFRRLSPGQNGIPQTLFSGNVKPVQNSNIAAEDRVVQNGNVLVFRGNRPDENFEVKLGDTISRDPAVVGRSTVVVNATSGRWPKTELVIKVSWPGSGQVPETEFLEKACAEAKKTNDEWAVNHLPQMLHARDFVFEPDSTLELVARLFQDAELVDGNFKYERRTLRIIIQERLYSIKLLTNVKDIGQVFLDIACIHRWLFDEPGILHRDLSFNNIMCRIVKESGIEDKVYGVLTDYDLSSWVASLKNDYNNTSRQRIGTPPYMAQELLKGTSDTHLYRHDIESLFYVMLLTCARHMFDRSNEAKWSVVMREGALPYGEWFNEQDYDTLGNHKIAFFSRMESIILSPAFEDFRVWLRDIRYSLTKGFISKISYLNEQEGPPPWRQKRTGGPIGKARPTPVPFDNETLGGHVHYSAIVEPTRYLKGGLQGLSIRYNPTSPPVPTGAAQADA